VAAAALCCVALSVPLAIVDYAPITDLPQHAAQIELLADALGNPHTPYSLVYGIIGLCWLVFGAMDAGRTALMLIGIVSTLALHVFAARRERPLATVTLVSVLFYSHVVYWGFYQFALGWPVFLLWLELVRRSYTSAWREVVALFLCSCLLYATHVLWLAVAIAWLAVGDLIFGRRLKSMIYRLATVLPALVLVAIWYPSLADYGFDSNTIWTLNPLERVVSLVWLFTATLGGLFGPAEYVVYALLLAWPVVGVIQSWGELRSRVDRELVLLGALFVVAALLLPDCLQRTIEFAKRWVPFGTTLLLLGLPAPRLGHRIVTGIAAGAVVAAFSVVTSISWLEFERTEMTGFDRVLSELPASKRVLGLDFVQRSEFVRNRPFMHASAYGQLGRGGTLHFSFADFGPSLILYREPRDIPWTGSLEWYPRTFDKQRDLQYFDYVIVNDTGPLHATAIRVPELEPVTHEGRWRLYRVVVAAP
jgi:hypothetical protein